MLKIKYCVCVGRNNYLNTASSIKNWMLRQPDQNNKGCLSIRFLLREFCNLRLADLNIYLNIASSKKQSDPRDFLKARFVKKDTWK